MSAKRSRSVLSSIAIVLFILCMGQFVFGQSNKPPDDKETLQALLKEVSMLRQALQTLQQMSVDTYRSQLLFDRIRVNREDLRRLTTSLNDTRETLSRTQRTIPTFTEQVKMMESLLQTEVDQTKRIQLDFELKRTKEALENYKTQIEPLKEREQNLVNELRTAQIKVDELENRLDLLERAIDSDRQKLENEKAAPVKSP